MDAFTPYEKIAQICRSYASGYAHGAFGKATNISGTGWRLRIEVKDGPCVLVRTTRVGWDVQFKGFIGTDPDLEQAARLALEAGRGVDVTRNYEVPLE